MTQLKWDEVGKRFYETGVSKGVLYIPDVAGNYDDGVAWNGLVSVTESPSGAEASAQYADNTKYLNLYSAEDFGATLAAFTYPREFAQFDGAVEIAPGVYAGQQNRKPFGLSYQTLLGNDTMGTDLGRKLHLVYGAMASPSEKAYTTVNDSPEAMELSWELTTSPVEVPGHKPSAILTINSTEVPADKLAELEDILYGTAGTEPRLPLPAEVIALFAGSVTETSPAAPTYNATTDTITIPSTTGVIYKIDGEPVTGDVVITETTVVTAVPAEGYVFPDVTDDDWLFVYS